MKSIVALLTICCSFVWGSAIADDLSAMSAQCVVVAIHKQDDESAKWWWDFTTADEVNEVWANFTAAIEASSPAELIAIHILIEEGSKKCNELQLTVDD